MIHVKFGITTGVKISPNRKSQHQKRTVKLNTSVSHVNNWCQNQAYPCQLPLTLVYIQVQQIHIPLALHKLTPPVQTSTVTTARPAPRPSFLPVHMNGVIPAAPTSSVILHGSPMLALPPPVPAVNCRCQDLDRALQHLDNAVVELNSLQQSHDELQTRHQEVSRDFENFRKETEESRKKLLNKEKKLKARETSITAREANQNEKDEALTLLKSHVSDMEQKIIELEDLCNNYKLKLLASEDIRKLVPNHTT